MGYTKHFVYQNKRKHIPHKLTEGKLKRITNGCGTSLLRQSLPVWEPSRPGHVNRFQQVQQKLSNTIPSWLYQGKHYNPYSPASRSTLICCYGQYATTIDLDVCVSEHVSSINLNLCTRCIYNCCCELPPSDIFMLLCLRQFMTVKTWYNFVVQMTTLSQCQDALDLPIENLSTKRSISKRFWMFWML